MNDNYRKTDLSHTNRMSRRFDGDCFILEIL